MDFAKGLCQPDFSQLGEQAMKVNVEIDCTPEEARRFLGLPDVSKANDAYVEAITKAVKGVGSIEQLQEMAKQIAPMGEMGMKFFQQFMQSGGMGGMGGKSSK
jgi:hypothetical protein